MEYSVCPVKADYNKALLERRGPMNSAHFYGPTRPRLNGHTNCTTRFVMRPMGKRAEICLLVFFRDLANSFAAL